MRYSIITPTILRQSLLQACESVNMQSSTDWEHIVVIDTDLSNDVLSKIIHPQRVIIRCERPHQDWGHTCTKNAYPLLKGDYVYRLDDDNFFHDEHVLRDLEIVKADWAIFPILRYGERFFNDPPGLKLTDTGSFIVKREYAEWIFTERYDADGYMANMLRDNLSYQSLSEMRPVMVMPHSACEVVDSGNKLSIYTACHNNEFLREAYDSIKDQDFYEWVIAFNNGGIPTNFDDPRVKPHVLYKAPDSVGRLKAYTAEQATGDVLMELDHDDMLMPTAVAEAKAAFEDKTVGFAYSNTLHVPSGRVEKVEKYPESFGWTYRDVEWRGETYPEFRSFPPTPESVSRVWFGPDHFRSFRRSEYYKIGGYNKQLEVLDDSDLVIRLFLHTRFKHIDKPLYVYRVHGNNTWIKKCDRIQKGVWPLYDSNIEALVEKWATDNSLALVELGDITRNGYKRAFSLTDLKTNSVGALRAIDVFAKYENPISVMKQVSRVLVPGGWLFCRVPSTDGRGAWQDPRHKSHWNENSFFYYTDEYWAKNINTPVRFQSVRLYTTEKDQHQVCWTIAHLINLKDGYRPCGWLPI